MIALGFASLLLWRAAHFVRTAEMEMKSRSAQLESVLKHADEAAIESVHVSRDTRINLVHLDRNQQRIARELSAVIAHTDKSVNGIGGLLFQATLMLDRVGTNVDNMGDRAIPLIDHADMAVLHLDDLIKSPAVIGSLKNIEEGTADAKRGISSSADSLEEVRQAIHEMRNPPKRTRGQRIMEWILRNVIGSAIQGAVRR